MKVPKRRVRMLVHIMSWNMPFACVRGGHLWFCKICPRREGVYCPALEYSGKPLEKHQNYLVEVMECDQHY